MAIRVSLELLGTRLVTDLKLTLTSTAQHATGSRNRDLLAPENSGTAADILSFEVFLLTDVMSAGHERLEQCRHGHTGGSGFKQWGRQARDSLAARYARQACHRAHAIRRVTATKFSKSAKSTRRRVQQIRRREQI
eukprot:5396827-Pleurochrysis_carterae.AAC.1